MWGGGRILYRIDDLKSISLKNNGIQTCIQSAWNSKKTGFSLSPKRVTVKIDMNPCLGNLPQMITTNSSKKNIVGSHSSIKVYFMPTRGRRGPRIMGRESRMLGRELPSLFMENEGFVNFLGKMWRGGREGEGIGVDGDELDWPLLSILFLWNHS